MTIELSSYGSAVFLADLEFTDKDYVSPLASHKLELIPNPSGSTSVKYTKNPNYPYKNRQEEVAARHSHEQKRRRFILDYLEEHYPTRDYATQFAKDNEWDVPLRLHTEQSLACPNLSSDNVHCNKKRENKTCYTCCFACELAYCESDECTVLNNHSTD